MAHQQVFRVTGHRPSPLSGPLEWNATLLDGDLAESVGRLKDEHHGNLIVGTPLFLLAFTVSGGRITEIVALVDQAKLALMDLPDPE